MLSIETQQRVGRLLLALSEGERTVSISRQVLSDNYDFDAYNIFSYLDTEGKNKIDAYDIMEYLKRKGIYASNLEIEMIILFYDQNGDGLLDFNEFIPLVQSEKSFKSMNNLSLSKNLSFNVDYSLKNLLEKEINNSRNILTLINDLRLRVDFNLHSIFHLLKGYSSITVDGIHFFLDSINATFLESDLTAILKRLDFNKDGKIDICELHSFLGFPLCQRCCPCKTECRCSCCNCCCMKNIKLGSLNKSFYSLPENISSIKEINENNSEIKRVSPNLTLRNSPQRKYSPMKINDSKYFEEDPLREENSGNILYSTNQTDLIQVSPNLTLRNSPQRKYSPERIFKNSSQCCCSPIKNNISILRTLNDNSFEKKQFLDYLKTVMDAENRIEEYKVDLALRADFNVEDAFRLFELNGRGYLTEEDLKNGFKLLELYVNNSDIRLLMKRYDLNKKGTIDFQDFFDMITPFEKEFRNIVENRPPNSSCLCRCPDVFMYTTRIYFKNLLSTLLDYENKFNMLRNGFTGLRNQIKEIYRSIDKFGIGYFTSEDLSNYLKTSFAFKSMKESDLLFIRLDRNRNGKVEEWEIEEELTPTF